MSKIAIVSDKTTLHQTIQSKLILLRKDDVIIKCDTENAIKSTSDADIILLHTPDLTEKTIDLITTLKKQTNEIILILETYNPKTLLNTYDKGIYDFCTINVTNYELLIKIINAKKALKKEKKLETLKNILKNKGSLKHYSEVYTNIADIINGNNIPEFRNSTILALTLISDNQKNLNINNFENNIPVRENDIIINYEPSKYLIILPQTSLQNGIPVFNKISEYSQTNIKGVIFEYNNENANEIKNKIKRLETELDNTNENLLTWEFKESEETEEDWLNTEITETKKNYKIFQNIYNKKIQSVIEPVFYRTKQKYEKTLKNTKIKYYTDKDRCEFIVVNFERNNTLQINFNNSVLLNINLIFKGLDTPENETSSVSFSDFTTRYLTDLLEEFIQKGEK